MLDMFKVMALARDRRKVLHNALIVEIVVIFVGAFAFTVRKLDRTRDTNAAASTVLYDLRRQIERLRQDNQQLREAVGSLQRQQGAVKGTPGSDTLCEAANPWRGMWVGYSNTTRSELAFDERASKGCFVTLGFSNFENPLSQHASHKGRIEGVVTGSTLNGRWYGRSNAEGEISLRLEGSDGFDGVYSFASASRELLRWRGVRTITK